MVGIIDDVRSGELTWSHELIDETARRFPGAFRLLVVTPRESGSGGAATRRVAWRGSARRALRAALRPRPAALRCCWRGVFPRALARSGRRGTDPVAACRLSAHR